MKIVLSIVSDPDLHWLRIQDRLVPDPGGLKNLKGRKRHNQKEDKEE
jgi:hypothetical protein